MPAQNPTSNTIHSQQTFSLNRNIYRCRQTRFGLPCSRIVHSLSSKLSVLTIHDLLFTIHGLFLIRQTAQDCVRAVNLFKHDDARHFVRQGDTPQRPFEIGTLQHTRRRTAMPADDECGFFDGSVLPILYSSGEVVRTPQSTFDIKRDDNRARFDGSANPRRFFIQN